MMREIIVIFSNEHPYVPASRSSNTNYREELKVPTSNTGSNKEKLAAGFKILSMIY